jgi:NAD(P)-dependent dehydrogenase (short-subunit alcohol dehydrogenase family)
MNKNPGIRTDKPWWIIVGGRRRLGCALAELLASDYNLVLTSSVPWVMESSWVVALSKKTNLRCFVWDAENPDLLLAIAANLTSLQNEGIVIKCAILASGTFQKDTFGQWDYEKLAKNWQVNLTFPLLVAQELSKYLAQDGCIQILLDTSAYKPFLKRLPHSIVEYGLKGMVVGLASLLAPKIRVIGHAIGTVLGNPSSDPHWLADKSLLRKLGTVRDLERALRFAADSLYITGAVIILDGGTHLL